MKRFITFVGIGGLSTLLQFALLIALVELHLLTELIASPVSYLLSSIFNYLANYHLTFKSNKSHTETLPKFMVAVGIGLTSNTLLYALFLWLLGNNNYLIAQILATGITVFLNFMIHKLWIYKHHD